MKLYPEQKPIANAATYETSRRTGFGENWSNALGLAISEDLPVTSPMISSAAESQRTKRIYDYVQSGEIPQSVHRFFGKDDDGMARYARDTLGLEGFATDNDYQEQVSLEYKTLREMSNQTFSQQSGLGLVGEIAGMAHAMALDPLYATSFLTGYGTAATVGQAALRVGVMEAGIEAVAQVPKMSWKEDIGSDYSGADAVTQVVFAGLGGAALAAVGKGLSRALTSNDLTVEQGIEVLERMSKDNPEIAPILNTLKNADPEDNLAKTLQADEAIDIRRADEGPPVGRDPKAAPEVKVDEVEAAEEAAFMARQPIEEEGVPRGTPTPDERHPMVKAADEEVTKMDSSISIMEECF